jgi:hypothetical protein
MQTLFRQVNERCAQPGFTARIYAAASQALGHYIHNSQRDNARALQEGERQRIAVKIAANDNADEHDGFPEIHDRAIHPRKRA